MLSGAKADLTLVKVADPATLVEVDVNNAAPAGTRWVGLEITSVDHSPFAGQESVQVDGIGSDGKTLTPGAIVQGFSHTLGAFKECTPAGSQDPDQTYTMCTGVSGTHRRDAQERRRQGGRRRDLRNHGGGSSHLDGPVARDRHSARLRQARHAGDSIRRMNQENPMQRLLSNASVGVVVIVLAIAGCGGGAGSSASRHRRHLGPAPRAGRFRHWRLVVRRPGERGSAGLARRCRGHVGDLQPAHQGRRAAAARRPDHHGEGDRGRN